MHCRTLEQEAIRTIKALCKDYDCLYVMFSGGKDSLVVLDLIRRADQNKPIVAIHVDTTAQLPENLRYVQEVCSELSVKLEILRPERDYFSLVRLKGFPTFRRRWCCDYLKLRPVKAYFKNLNNRRIVFDGVRAEESKRRLSYTMLGWDDLYGCKVFRPIFNWRKSDVERYIREHQLPINPLYSIGFTRATDCWCGLYKSVKDFRLLKEHFPDFFAKLLELEESMRNKGSYAFLHGKKVYLRDIV